MDDGNFFKITHFARTVAIVMIATIGTTTADVAAQQIRWRNSTDVRRKLAQPNQSSYTWQGISLRSALRDLSQSEGVRIAMLLDRRVDPGKKLNLTFTDQPLEDVLLQIADTNDMGMCQIGPVIYFGPQWTTYRLRTVVEAQKDKVLKMPIETRRRFRARSVWKWDKLATPRGLFKQLAREGKLKIEGLEKIPHDLWAQADLPSLALLERLCLLAAAYDLTLQISPVTAANLPSVVKLVPIPEKVAIIRSYPGGDSPKALAKKLQKSFPDAKFAVKKGKLYVKGRAEDQAMIRDLLAGKSVSRKKVALTGETRIDKLNVDRKPVGKVLETLAQGLKLELAMDKTAIAEAGISLDQLVSINVKKATIAEVFENITNQAGLSYEIVGSKIIIRPKK